MLVCPDEETDWQDINTSELTVKLGDFGLSKTYEDEDSMSFSGTFAFIPPEVRQAYGQAKRITAVKSVDIWAAGLVAVMLLTAEVPPGIETFF